LPVVLLRAWAFDENRAQEAVFFVAASWSFGVDLPSVIPAIQVLYNRIRDIDLGG
jgi:hypothetical protein